MFITGGVLLGILSGLFISSPATPIFMAVALALIGVVFILTYAGGLRGEVQIHAGRRAMRCVMRPKALDDMAVFVERFYEIKLGTDSDARIANSHDAGDANNSSSWAAATAAGGARSTG